MQDVPHQLALLAPAGPADGFERAVSLRRDPSPQVAKREAHRPTPRPMAPGRSDQGASGYARRIFLARPGGIPCTRHLDTACRDTDIRRATSDCPISLSNETASSLSFFWFAIRGVNHSWHPLVNSKSPLLMPKVAHGARPPVDTGAPQPLEPEAMTQINNPADPYTYGGRLQAASDATHGASAARPSRSSAGWCTGRAKESEGPPRTPGWPGFTKRFAALR